ncbi:hypothetical protein BD769DRAFT_1488456 [Suillus cothurnatus]|nr:hypothetical protein BD769DRAFT_1488456 [Suillus cothurnatus]
MACIVTQALVYHAVILTRVFFGEDNKVRIYIFDFDLELFMVVAVAYFAYSNGTFTSCLHDTSMYEPRNRSNSWSRSKSVRKV